VAVGPPTDLIPPAKVVETHISTLFFVGERVYKLRKPVQFGFLDFRDRAARQVDCQREVALNRRLAPDVYLGVADIEMEGEPVDHLVVMRRMPDDRRLGALATTGADIDGWLRQVARVLVSFHDDAVRSSEISAAAAAPALLKGWEANFAEARPFVGTLLHEEIDTEIRSLAARWITGRQPLLAHRMAAGRVCDGHGDLQAGDIFCLDDGVRILDCIEFSDRLRYCDVVADVAFLAVDLERLGRPQAAARFLRHYQELSGDLFPNSLVHHYGASRAYVRAKVACLRAAQGDDEAGNAARQMHVLALDHLRRARVSLVVVGGVPGSGKSTLADGLGAARGWSVLRTDEIRREMSPPEGARASGYRAGRYSPTATAAVYEELLRRATRALESGESVVLDASWIDAGWRDAARQMADRTSSDLIELCCHVERDEGTARILRRLSESADPSEATPQIRAEMARSMDPWPSALIIDTSGASPEQTLATALQILG